MNTSTTMTPLLSPYAPHQKPGYVRWKAKQIWAYLYLRRLKKTIKIPFGFDFKASLQNLSGSGIIAPPEGWLRELPRQLPNDKNAIDSISFCGMDERGTILITSLARRNDRTAEIWVYLRLASGEEYQLPIQPDSLVYNTNNNEFTAAGLTFEVLEPLRCWRVNFNGLLRKGVKTSCNSNYSDTIRVRFYFIWQQIYRYTAYPADFNVSLMSKVLADESWTNGISNSMHIKNSSIEWHEQWGQLSGTLNIDNEKEIVLRLKGTKKRTHGVQEWNSVERFLEIKGIHSDGTAYAFYGQSLDENPIKFYHGQVVHPSGIRLLSVSHCQIISHDNDTKGNFTLDFTCESQKRTIDVSKTNSLFNVFVGENWDCEIRSVSAAVCLNGKQGTAIITFGTPNFDGRLVSKRTSEALLTEPDIKINECSSLVVTFKDDYCQCSKLVGGKGASLALMSSLDSKVFEVPYGFCVTRNGFDLFLKGNREVEEAIEKLEAVAWKKLQGKLEEECKKVTDCIINTETIPPQLTDDLIRLLKTKHDDHFHEVQFAIRSSAIGEDSKELSAAGQNETFLGVKGLDQIVKSIIRCWASQFSFRSVEYKRQNGQLINGGMAIVIQQMVPSDVAGVLFSKDPLSGCMDTIAITANYGLGESVVSAAADPDTIQLKRQWDDTLSIQSKEIGRKTLKIIMNDDGGIMENKTTLIESSQCVLSDEVAIKLGQIAIYLERCFGDGRDIEWAIHNGKIYLLQSRPVTSDVVLTDYEVLHELDTPPRTESEHYSTSNVAEVMPGAMSQLAITGIYRAHACGFAKMFRMTKDRYDATAAAGFGYFYNHVFLDMIQQRTLILEKTKSKLTKAIEVTLYGRVLEDSEIVRKAKERFDQQPFKLKLMLAFACIYGLMMGKRSMRRTEQKYRKYPIPGIKATSASQSYNEIGLVLGDLIEAFMNHLFATVISSFSNAIILCILSGNSEEFTAVHFNDFATLIGTANGAESGDVPVSIKKLALLIAKEIDQQTFVEMPSEEAFQWLESGSNESSKRFQEFLENHGHRCYKEFDVSSLSWGMEPIKVVKILQNTLRSEVKEIEPEEKTSTSLDMIKSPLTRFKRKLLSWVMSYSRTSMLSREQGKSLLIKYIDGMRLGYRHLATLMQQEGYIPEPELIYFFTNDEIRQLLETRSPRILMRAKRRSKMHPYMEKLMFTEEMVGYPKPIDVNEKSEELDLVSQIKGFTVCQGVVKGTARVIHNYDEVNTIEKGDILITHTTDIGWSPYFPMLSGIVTEIGGLVSHGAVVAREYNLPCIIGATNATQVFNSGEPVILNATEGTLTKVAAKTATASSHA